MKNKSLQETTEAQEKAKRQLEDEVDALNARLANAGGGKEAAGEAAQEQQQKVVAQLRDQIAEKNNQIKQLTVRHKKVSCLRK